MTGQNWRWNSGRYWNRGDERRLVRSERSDDHPPKSGRAPGSPYAGRTFLSASATSGAFTCGGARRARRRGLACWTAAASPAEAAPQPVVFRQEHLNAPNENLVMREAGPLLLALGQFRASLVRAPSAQLMEQVAQAIEEFEQKLRTEGLPSSQVNVAKYVLCATADDIVQNMPVEDRQIWTRYSMLSRFFGERVGGVRFFDELDSAKADPALNYPVLELMHACLALGFEGIHRTSVGGSSALQGIQRTLYETLRRIKSRSTDELSPHWQGQALAARASLRRIPVWAIASVLAVFLFGFFITLRLLLATEAETVTAALASLTPDGPVAIDRPIDAPPPPPRHPILRSRNWPRSNGSDSRWRKR